MNVKKIQVYLTSFCSFVWPFNVLSYIGNFGEIDCFQSFSAHDGVNCIKLYSVSLEIFGLQMTFYYNLQSVHFAIQNEILITTLFSSRISVLVPLPNTVMHCLHKYPNTVKWKQK